MARPRQSSPSAESSASWGTAHSGPSAAPLVPTPPKGRRTRSSWTASPEQVTSALDSGHTGVDLTGSVAVGLGEAVKRLLNGEEQIPRRQREKVLTETRDKLGRPFTKDELRKIRRRKTNRESAARTRQFRQLDKQQLREEVSELLTSNMQVSAKLGDAQDRIAAMTAELQHIREMYDSALHEKDHLVHTLHANGKLTAAAAPGKLSSMPCSSGMTASLAHELLPAMSLELGFDGQLPGIATLDHDLLGSAVWNAHVPDLLPPSLPALAPTGRARYLPEMPQIIMPPFPAEPACRAPSLNLDTSGDMARIMPGTMAALPGLDMDFLGGPLP